MTTGAFTTPEDVENAYREIGANQYELVDNGLLGMIWMPVRHDLPYVGGLVSTNAGIGVKNEEMFCAVGEGLDSTSNVMPMTLYLRVPEQETVNCTLCTAYDIAVGNCNRNCDNGPDCVLPEGLPADHVKCPEASITSNCILCDQVWGTITCDFTYRNGTKKTVSYLADDISSDIYMDVIAGLDRPYKCCLEDETGSKYSYVKQTMTTISAVPIIFPKSGLEGMSCRMNDDFSGFCGSEFVPVRDYEVNCSRSEMPKIIK
jgi:hypothetical protein